ncbi:MAG: radical SAM protein [Candidatus Kapaibacterium sp.]
MNRDFSPETLYRLPWNFADNAISWLEPTSKCNLYCDGCYRENKPQSHKPLDVIDHELDVFQKNRKTDGVSIAGGEPLTHPDIVEIVRMVKKRGWKPIINSNGALLTKELLKELKKAGVYGFTLHVDSGQRRQGWQDKNEIELNELRYELATMLHEAKNISCSFNATIYPENEKYVPELLKWSQKHIDRVHVMVFILYRMAILGKDFDFYVGDQQVEFDDIMYSKKDDNRRTDISSPELVDLIRETEPGFMPSAFLNGTENTATYKWLLTGRMGNKHKIFGYTGPKFMEIVQTFKHMFTDKYLAYSTPRSQKRGRSYFWLAPFDKGLREIMKNYFACFPADLKAFFSKMHYQSVMIIQPADIYEDGRVNMCDGCPDITVWNDQLVWSCRMEEQNKWGQNVRMVPRKKISGEEKKNGARQPGKMETPE